MCNVSVFTRARGPGANLSGGVLLGANKCAGRLTMREAPPPACRAGGAAGSRAARGPPAGFGRHNLAVHGAQQQHQTHGPKHLGGTRPGDLVVQQDCRH